MIENMPALAFGGYFGVVLVLGSLESNSGDFVSVFCIAFWFH